MFGRKLTQRAAGLGAALLIALGLAPVASAQHTPDPYNIVGDGNLGYQDYMYSNYPNGIGYSPNQGILSSRSSASRANTFSNYVDELDGVGSGADSLYGSSRGRGGIQPYYRAHRQYDEVFNRVYSPNAAPDKTYEADQKVRTDKYLEYLRESDPRKRAQLYREYTQSSLRAARDLGSGPTARSSVAPRPAAATTRSSSALPATSSTPAAPRVPSAVGAARSRRPTSLPPATNRAQSTATATSPTYETPEQILNRAELMERARRATTRPAAPSPTPAPAP